MPWFWAGRWQRISTAIAARQCKDAYQPVVGDQVRVEMGNVQDGLASTSPADPTAAHPDAGPAHLEESLGLGLVGALDEHLRPRNGNEACPAICAPISNCCLTGNTLGL